MCSYTVLWLIFTYCVYNIKHYNDRYGRKIEQTKDQFGTSEFDPKVNKYITSNLYSIASITQDIYNDLKKARLLLNKITPLVYQDCHGQLQDNSTEKWLEISGCDSLELFSKFVNNLHILGEWHNSKLKAVRELDIQNNKKTKSDKQIESKAFNDIKLCVDSLSEFMGTNVLFDRSSSSAECYGQHQQWCCLSHTKVEMVTIPVDGRHCSC